MKKIIMTLLFALVTTICAAQHFQFMGIPIDGSIENFDTKLKAKGFVKSKIYGLSDESNIKWYDGTYAGYAVSLCVRTTPRSNLVNSVTVFKYVNTENEAKDIFDYITESITKKYKVERNLTESDTNNKFFIENGVLVVDYEKDGSMGNYRVDIIYFDIQNLQKEDEEKYNDI